MTRRLVIIDTTTEIQGSMTVARDTKIEVRCDRCAHWGSPADRDFAKRSGNVGHCARVESWCENGNEPMPMGAAVDLIEPIFSGGFCTDADFGCALFTEKTGETKGT